jgi:aminopeptidase N
MTWLHWIVEQVSRVRAKKVGDAASRRANASGLASEAELQAGVQQRNAEYARLEQERTARLRSERGLN